MPQFLDIVDFAQIPSTNMVFEQLATAPAGAVEGQVYYNTTDNHVYRFTGATWVAIGQISSSDLVVGSQNNDGTFSIALSASDTGVAGTIALWNASGGLTANVTGDLTGTADNATMLAGQTSGYFLDLGNSTGTLPSSAGGIGVDVSNGADGQIPIVSAGVFTLSVISAGPGITVTNGPGSITIAAYITGASAPVDATYVVLTNNPSLTNERALAVGANQLVITDGGANGSVTLSLSAVAQTPGTFPKVTFDEFGRVTAGTALVSGDIPSLNKTKIADFVESDYVHTTGNESIAGVKTFTDTVVIDGDLFVGGTTTTVTSQELLVSDTIIEVAYGNTGPVPGGVGGLQVDRWGTPTSAYLFVFEEARDGFVVGLSGSTQMVATREDAPISGGIAVWDSGSSQFRTVGDLTIGSVLTSGSSLNGANLVAGSVPNSALTNSSLTVAAGDGLAGGGVVALGGTTTLSLGLTGVSSSYYKVTTDIYGRVIAGQSVLTSADIFGNIPWTKVSSTPTTLAGYGITDAVDNFSDQTINGQKDFGLTPTVSGTNVVYHSGNLNATTLHAITAVGMSVPSFLSVAPTTIFSPSGSFAVTLVTQTSGSVFAGPANGAAAAPAFRALVASDIPAINVNVGQIVGTLPLSAGGTGVSVASTVALRQALSLATVSAATISGNGVAKLFNIAHTYGNADLGVFVKDIAGGGAYVLPNISANSSQVSVSFASAPLVGKTYRVIINGVGA
jgi:hypothetical protein